MKRKAKGCAIPNDRGHTKHKNLLHRRGWTYRTAAKHLGISLTHLDRTLQGARDSRSLLRRIEALPVREEAQP